MNKKNLERQVETADKTTNRRQFLSLVGRGAGAALATASLAPILFDSGCKNSPTGPSEPPESVPVNLQFDIYNHTQGHIATFTKDKVMSGSSLSFSVSSIKSQYGITNVDNVRMVVRTKTSGAYINYTHSDSLTFVAPQKDTSYDMFLFNNVGTQLYSWMETQTWPIKLLPGSTTFPVYRKDSDGQTGDEGVWGGRILAETGNYGVFDQLNNVLNPQWASFRFGIFNRDSTGTNGKFSYGFGECYGRESWYFYPNENGISVNARLVPDIAGQVARGLGVVIDHIVGWDHLGGDLETYRTIQNGGVLNQAGKDLIAYFFLTKS